MKNQNNVSSLNNPQIGQEQVNDSAVIPESPKQKYFIVGFVILVFFVLFGLGGYYFRKQNQSAPLPVKALAETINPTADWKTYTDTNDGFSLKYPGDYFIYEGDPALGFILTTSAPEGGTGPKLLGENDLRFGASGSNMTDKNQTLDQYLNKQQSVFKNSQNTISKNSVMIGGVSGYRVTYSFQTTPEGTTSTTLYASDVTVIKNGRLYSVSFSSFNQKLLESKQSLFDQILSTFQFTEQTANVDKNAVSTIVKNFYDALASQDGRLLFSLFTPPISDLEKKDLIWLTGADIGATPQYRVFLRTKILNPKIDETREINLNTVVARISDQTQTYSNAGAEAGWGTPKARNTVFMTLVKSSDKWLVDKYMDPANFLNKGNAGTTKYNGFGQ